MRPLTSSPIVDRLLPVLAGYDQRTPAVTEKSRGIWADRTGNHKSQIRTRLLRLLARLRHMIAVLAERGLPWADFLPSARGIAPMIVRMESKSAAASTDHRADADAIDMTELVREHADSAYRVALSIVRDPNLAEDITQDALIKAWQALPTFRGDSPLRNWVLRITHNTAISTLRKRREELRDPDLLPEEASAAASVHNEVATTLTMERFMEALDELDDVSRSVVVLRELEQMSYDEICSVLDLPLPTVKTRLLRSRRTLALALEDWRP